MREVPNFALVLLLVCGLYLTGYAAMNANDARRIDFTDPTFETRYGMSLQEGRAKMPLAIIAAISGILVTAGVGYILLPDQRRARIKDIFS